MRRLALVLLVFLAGCGRQWVRPGVPQLESDRDHYACIQEAARQFPYANEIARGGMRDACMRARGYEWQ